METFIATLIIFLWPHNQVGGEILSFEVVSVSLDSALVSWELGDRVTQPGDRLQSSPGQLLHRHAGEESGHVGLSEDLVQIENPLTTSLKLTGLKPFTSYQVMLRGVAGPGHNMSRVQTSGLVFTTATQPTRNNMDNVSVKDLVLVVLLLLLWLLVIMLFLHRWGE